MYNDDDSRKSDEEYMRALYERFRQEVESGSTIDYYEINELLDIYDYAQDEGDAMVQMFVFLTVARLYPDSKDFEERMAFFLSYVSQEAASDMASRDGRRESALWDVLRMGVKCYPAGDVSPYLDELFKKYNTLDCESILKIIDLLREMDQRNLLVTYYKELSERAEDPRGLAFEIAETLKEGDGYQEDARNIAEELTKMEPFNVDAWLLLARIEFGLEHKEDALAAVDYALAIDPDYFNARLTRGVIMVIIPEKREEAIKVLKDILASEPYNHFALEGLAEAYIREKRIREACDIYATMLRNNIPLAGGADPLLVIIELNPDNLEEYLQEIVDKGVRDDDYWRGIAVTLFEKEAYVALAKALDYYYKRKGFNAWIVLYLRTLYYAGWLERYAEVFESVAEKEVSQATKTTQIVDLSISDYLMLASVYLRLGRKEEAASLSNAIENNKEVGHTMDERLSLRGIRYTARLIYSLATTENLPETIKDLDPLMGDFPY